MDIMVSHRLIPMAMVSSSKNSISRVFSVTNLLDLGCLAGMQFINIVLALCIQYHAYFGNQAHLDV